MAQAAGVFKQLTYKVESTYGTVPGASAAQALRRVTSDLSLTKQTYQSNEIRTDQQMQDYRHGVRSVEGGSLRSDAAAALSAIIVVAIADMLRMPPVSIPVAAPFMVMPRHHVARNSSGK